MSDPNPNPRTTPPPPQSSLPPEEPARSSGPGAFLWIIILLLLIAAVWYFMGRRDDAAVPTPAPTPIGDTAPIPSQSPVSEPDRARAERERTPATSAPARITRDANVVDKPAPEYPAAAVRAGEEGTVIVRVEVGTDGKPTDVSIAQRSRSRDLDRAALNAVRGWTFQAAMRDGQPVASTVQVPVEFTLGTR